jgi:hypothetical protein
MSEYSLGRGEIVPRKGDRLRAIQVDISEPIARFAKEYADISGLREALTKFLLGEALVLPPVATGILRFKRYVDEGPTTRVVTEHLLDQRVRHCLSCDVFETSHLTITNRKATSRRGSHRLPRERLVVPLHASYDSTLTAHRKGRPSSTAVELCSQPATSVSSASQPAAA